MSERVIIVGVETQNNRMVFEQSMEELANLTETANGEVVARLIQKRTEVSGKTIIGKGKLAELAALVETCQADLVIFNQELSPRQGQNLSEGLACRVIDRIQLILAIFAMRARSKEGQLQVELAQLSYELPRLTGQGTALSRLGAGIGTRGPGETKLETDRRHIRQRITSIKNELKAVSAHRERNRQQRKASQVFQIGLIGYTNSGKSTIFNQITEAGTYEKDELFATLDPLTKRWQLPAGFVMTLTDTVGFIQELPTQLIEAFQSTLEESRSMDLLFHVVDASAPNRDVQEQTVLTLLKELGLENIPLLTLYNKADKIDQTQFVPTLFPNYLLSARSPTAKEELETALRQRLMEILTPYQKTLSPESGYLIQQLKQETLVISDTYAEEENHYQVRGYALARSRWVKEDN